MELKLEKPWKEVKALMMEHQANLTEADLKYENGREDELIAKVSSKIGRTAEATKEWIESISFNK
jgi:uncharacterized protein YjbJ (UPF0337 family)